MRDTNAAIRLIFAKFATDKPPARPATGLGRHEQGENPEIQNQKTKEDKKMSIFLKPVQRRNPQNPQEPMKWYPVQNTVKNVDESEVAELIADETTLNPMEAMMAVRQLRKIVQRLLLGGNSVQLGNWGTFNITLSTEGAATKDALTARNVKSVNINFQAGSELKAALQKADFVWLNKLVDGTTDSTETQTAEETNAGA